MTHAPATWTRETAALPARDLFPAMRRGAAGRCPACGSGRMFGSYLATQEHCGHCDEALHHHRADDAPPYFTIAIVAHIMVPLLLFVEKGWQPALWLHMAVWLPLTVVLCLVLLPIVKGALVALQWALYMHGFDPRSGGSEEWDGVGLAPGQP